MKRETYSEMRERILKLTDGGDYGICPPPIKAQTAIHEPCQYLLGDGWYIALSLPAEQANTEIVYAIESLYKRRRITP